MRCTILFDHFLNYLPRRLTPCTSNEDTTPKVKKKMRGLALSRNHVNQTSSLVSGLAGLATLMLACLALAALISLRAWTIALLAVMVRASVTTMAVWLCLNRNGEVLSRLSNSVDQDLITIWPFSLKLFLLVVLSEGRLSDFIIEKSDMCSFECSLAGGVCAFDLGVLVTADTISVVVDGCLEDYTNYQLIPSKVRKKQAYHSVRNHQLRQRHCPSALRHWAWCQGGHQTLDLWEPWQRQDIHLHASTPRDWSHPLSQKRRNRP